ncbi:hypothetical protein ACFOY2_51440 [Nonomuraea purpurea]|uniref:Esterase n=1 Tax=Nonomuraea purpurea TaxID=1849276 RepID=A0ABV8GP05_9ACTN
MAYDNSLSCLRDLRARGVKATLTDVGDIDHMTSAFLPLPWVLDWFGGVRGGDR